MKRENEFRAYLQNIYKDNNTVEAYIDYCEKVEESFDGKDMDEIIISYKNIAKTRTKLSKITSSKKTVSNCITGLNRYLEFAFRRGMGASVLTGVSSKGVTASGIQGKIGAMDYPLVQYYSNVPVTERDETLRKALEEEYPKILEFAKNIFGVDYGYIPVYLSKETPPLKRYKINQTFLNKLSRKCERQQRMCDLEHQILETGWFTMLCVAKFFGGEKPYIEIYYKNLPKYNTLEAAINYLAHEYMHFIEYVYCSKNGVKSFVDERVSEALADFFGFLYSINRGGKQDLVIAEDRYILWKILSGSGWPYAYAIYFMKKRIRAFSPVFADYENNDCISKLVEVFNATKDAGDAYNKLKKI